MKDQKEIIIFTQFYGAQTHLSQTWRGKQSVIIIKKACTCFFNKYFMICHLLPRRDITHHSHCILSSCGMTKTGLIMLRSYKFRTEGSRSWQAMSRAMNLELQELALSACCAPDTSAGLTHWSSLAESSKKHFFFFGKNSTSGAFRNQWTKVRGAWILPFPFSKRTWTSDCFFCGFCFCFCCVLF